MVNAWNGQSLLSNPGMLPPCPVARGYICLLGQFCAHHPWALVNFRGNRFSSSKDEGLDGVTGLKFGFLDSVCAKPCVRSGGLGSAQ